MRTHDPCALSERSSILHGGATEVRITIGGPGYGRKAGPPLYVTIIGHRLAALIVRPWGCPGVIEIPHRRISAASVVSGITRDGFVEIASAQRALWSSLARPTPEVSEET
jgi:hypothetical protein